MLGFCAVNEEDAVEETSLHGPVLQSFSQGTGDRGQRAESSGGQFLIPGELALPEFIHH